MITFIKDNHLNQEYNKRKVKLQNALIYTISIIGPIVILLFLVNRK